MWRCLIGVDVMSTLETLEQIAEESELMLDKNPLSACGCYKHLKAIQALAQSAIAQAKTEDELARLRADACIGYPDCDGDLVAEPHSEKCIAGRSESTAVIPDYAPQ